MAITVCRASGTMEEDMSLLENAMTECVMLDRSTVPDGAGGYVPTWTDGARFGAAITFNTSMQARIGEVQGVKSLYTVTTKKTMNLQNRDIFKRLEDNKIFRVTSDGDDNKTPSNARLNMRQVTAEEYILPG